jgi:hypothetical protein
MPEADIAGSEWHGSDRRDGMRSATTKQTLAASGAGSGLHEAYDVCRPEGSRVVSPLGLRCSERYSMTIRCVGERRDRSGVPFKSASLRNGSGRPHSGRCEAGAIFQT